MPYEPKWYRLETRRERQMHRADRLANRADLLADAISAPLRKVSEFANRRWWANRAREQADEVGPLTGFVAQPGLTTIGGQTFETTFTINIDKAVFDPEPFAAKVEFEAGYNGSS